MLAKNIIAAIGILLIGGCAVSPEKSTEAELVVEDANIIKERPGSISVDDAVLDKDDLYLLLMAELAGQRGLYEIAMEAYSRAAEHIADPQIAERAAKIALYLKDKEKAERAVGLWLERDPENITARKIAALTALRNADKEAALDHLNFLLKEEGESFEGTLLEIIKILDSEGKNPFAYDVLDALAAQHPREAVIYYVQGLLAMQLHQPDVAQKKIHKALALKPDWNKALLLKAQLSAYSGDLQAAKDILRNALRKEPKNPQIQKMLAQVCIKSGDYKAAAEVFRGLLRQHPEDAEAKYQLALVYLQMQQVDKAQPLLNDLLLNPGWSDQASLYLGRIEAQRGDLNKALIWFDKVQDGPLAMEAAMNAVSLLVSAGRAEDAVQRLNALKTRFPKEELRLVLLEAEIYTRQKRYQQAFDILTRALDAQPKQKELLYTRALVAENLDRLDVLEEDLKAILAQDPDDVNALNALGYTLADRTSRYEEAEKYLSQAIKLQPGEAVIMDSYGWLQYRLGKYNEALNYLQRAYQQHKEAEIAAHVVETLWAMGRKRDAQRFYDEALKEVSDKQELLDLKQRLKGL